MKAKFVNEIKRDSESSGLSTIGVGKVAMYKSYNYFKKHGKVSSKTIERFLKGSQDIIDFKKLESLLDPPYSNYLLLKEVSREFMEGYLEDLNGKTKNGFIDNKNDFEEYINMFYNEEFMVGFFNKVSNDVDVSHKIKTNEYVFFVKYQ